MRVLFLGDLAHTGFGTVTRDLGQALINLGHDLRFVSYYDMPDKLEEPFLSRTLVISTFISGPDGVTDIHEEAIKGVFAGRTIASLANGEPWGEWKPEAVIVLGDFLAARIAIAPYLDLLDDVPWKGHYVPVEGMGLPPAWGDFWRRVPPVAMSQFGAEQIAKVLGYLPPVAYHGVDTDTFRPVSKKTPIILKAPDKQPTFLGSKEECKQAWVDFLAEQNNLKRVPRNWLLRTDRHMPRKRYNALLRSLMPVLARHPDWALVIHCNPWDQGGNLLDELSKYPELIRQQVLLTGISGISRELLVSLYNAADIYVSNSAEGFGLTIAEAVACGVPAVGVGYSSVPEVIGPAGRIVAEGGLIDNEYDHFWWAANEEQFGRITENLMTHPMRREDLGRRGPAHIRNSFTWSAAATVFSDLMTTALEAAA